MKPVRLDDEARDELLHSAEWYEAQQPELGHEFFLEVRATQVRIQERPAAHPAVPGMPADVQARRAWVARFPYALVFIELEHEIRVLAVAHVRRRPGYWRDRMRG